MRKLKLQVQMTVNGFVGGPNGEQDWVTWDMDDNFLNYIDQITDSVDTILMGRKMADEFVSYWIEYVKNEPVPYHYPFAKKMVDYPKVVFSKTLNASRWENTSLVKGNIVDEVNKLKKQKGRDMVVYGGAGFASSLIKNNLIDEYHLFINPAAIGKGLSIFGEVKNNFKLKHIKTTPFECGIVEHIYLPA